MISHQTISSAYNALLVSNNKKNGSSSASSSRTTSSSLTVPNTTLLSYSSWKQIIKDTLCSQIDNRKNWQRLEFITCWIFAFLLLVSSSLSGVTMKNNDNTIVAALSNTTILVQAAKLYTQISVITRILAYAVDFANASKKLGSVPSWLIFHHMGAVIMHLSTAMFFSWTHSTTMILYMLSMQSTHNTWTKKYSLALYWSNVGLGAFTTPICTTLNIMQNDLSYVAILCSMIGYKTTVVGVILLISDSMKQKQNKKK